jgi:CheY-like chemotaxis protein
MFNILIVDDEPDLLDILADELEVLGKSTIVKASDGLDAYRKARNQPFDLICTDYKMPRLTGGALIRALREAKFNSKTPVIVISGYPDEARLEIERDGHMSNVIIVSKPYKPDELIELCRKSLAAYKPDSETKKSESENKVKLDVEFVNPFLEATIETVKSMCQVPDIKVDKTFVLKGDEDLKVDISGVLSIVAPKFMGTIYISFPKDTFLSLTSKMLGTEFKEITAEISDAAAELTNIIYSNAKSALNKKNLQMEKAIPSVVNGAGHSVNTRDSSASVVTQFSCSSGIFYVSLGLNNK